MKAIFYSVMFYWAAFIALLMADRFNSPIVLSDSLSFRLAAAYVAGFPVMLLCACFLWKNDRPLAWTGFLTVLILGFLTLRYLPTLL